MEFVPVTKTELILYQTDLPIVNNSNGVIAVEKFYPTMTTRVRKFAASDITLLNGLYSVREGNGYLWSVKGVLEEFEKRTGKSISRSTLYRRVNQTRERRATALVLATRTSSAIEVYNNSKDTVPYESLVVSPKEIELDTLERLQINTPDQLVNALNGRRTSRIPTEILESYFVNLAWRQMSLAEGRMQFEENKRNWKGVEDARMLGYMLLNYNLWVDRLPEETREAYIRAYAPVWLYFQQKLASKKVDEKPNLFQRALGIFSRR